MAQSLDLVQANSDLFSRLLATFARDKWPQNILISGPNGGEQIALALGLAQALICEGTKAPCGVCGPCIRLSKGNSESALIIRPERRQIRAEQGEQIRHFVSLRAVSRQVVIVENVQWMTSAAANSLLKVFEEPPSETYFILTTDQLSQVLSTVRSRSFMVRTQSANSVGPDQEEYETKASQLWKSWAKDPALFLVTDWREDIGDRTESLKLASAMLRFFVKSYSEKPEPSWIQLAQESVVLQNDLLANGDPILAFESFWIRSQKLAPPQKG